MPDDHDSPPGVFTTDTALTIRAWNVWLAHATGMSAEEVRGRPLAEVIPDLELRGLLLPFQQVLSRGTVEMLAPAFHNYLIACPPSEGSRTFDRMQQRVTIGPLREDGGIVGTIVAIEDVTARVERERELAAELAHLDPAVRLRAAAQLAETDLIDPADPLVSAIGDENWRVRRAAVAGLRRRHGAGVIASVLQTLRDDHHDFGILSSAIELLTAGDVDILDPLLELLSHPDVNLRLHAALVLGERGDARAVEALLAALGDPDDNVRFHAVEALGKLKAIAAVDRLTALAESGDFFLAFPALEALAQIGESSVAPRLVPLMANELLRDTVVHVLGRLGDEHVVVPLTRLLNEATAPTEVVAAALAGVYERYDARYRDGEHIALLVRRSIAPPGTQSLLDAVQSAPAEHLNAISQVLSWLEGPAVARALTRLLGNSSLRGKVVAYLVRHGPHVVDLLIEQLDAEDLDTRHAAVVGLGRIGDRRATAALLRLLATDSALTVATAGALARIGDVRAFESLFELVGHPDAAIRQAVIAALNSIGHPAMAGRVAPMLRDERPQVRESAVRIAGYFGYPECADDLLACCQDPDPTVQRAALEHLAFLDDVRVAPTLTNVLRAGGDARIRCAAAQALARLDDQRVKGPLVEGLADPDPWVRYFAARALGEQRHGFSVYELTQLALDDPAGHVRLAAIDTLGAIGDPAAIPALSMLTTTDDTEQSEAAIRALGAIPHQDSWAPLESALRADDERRRAGAATAIAQLGGAKAVERLGWAAAVDGSSSVIAAAVYGLAAIARAGSDADAAVGTLVRLAADPARRETVVSALATLPHSLIGQVAHGLSDPRSGVRIAVVEALGRMRHVDASLRLQSALDDGSPAVRLAALAELRHLGTRGITRRLVSLARHDQDTTVRRAALVVLQGAPGGQALAGVLDGDTPTSDVQ